MQSPHHGKGRIARAVIDEDVLFRRICEHVERTGLCSVSDIQLRIGIGVNLAFKMVERMIDNGVVPVPPDRLN